ncbi:WD40-repeat-containing domain protein [Chytridium lagenaria]|nr:WD40-repeat-containing domain protein [Chytridium lagenaria]
MAAGQAHADLELLDPPSDGITALSFHPLESNILLASSWDKTVSLYDIVSNKRRFSYKHKAGVLDVIFTASNHAYSGGLDRELKCVDLAQANETIIGKHDDAIRSVQYSEDKKAVFTGSWDKSIKVWDTRSSTPEGTYAQPSKVFSMDLVGDKLVVALSGRKVLVYDTRNMSAPIIEKGSSMKFMSRAVRCMPNAQGYALSSIEGRIAVEYFDQADEKKKYAFRCHREKTPEGEIVHPVNALAFHPTHGTFASGGGTKRLKQFPRYPTSISALSFSPDGRTLAIASSYTYEDGEKE